MENLTRKSQLQEDELEKTTKQLKEAIAIASEETAKCKAAKEVIKSLTSQVQIPILQTNWILWHSQKLSTHKALSNVQRK